MLCGCRTPATPAIDLSDPAWRIHQGQAVWVSPNPKGQSEGVAGELLLATQSDGSCWVQFAKPPFSLVTAQRTPKHWTITFQQGRQRYGASGSPPAKLIWFQLPRALTVISGGQSSSGTGISPVRAETHGRESLDSPWKFQRNDDDTWLLENPKTGERLEGYLTP